jgi:hypothetical protein
MSRVAETQAAGADVDAAAMVRHTKRPAMNRRGSTATGSDSVPGPEPAAVSTSTDTEVDWGEVTTTLSPGGAIRARTVAQLKPKVGRRGGSDFQSIEYIGIAAPRKLVDAKVIRTGGIGIAVVGRLSALLNCSVVAGQLGSETGRALQGDLSGEDVFHSKMAEHLTAAQTFALRSPTRCVGQRGTRWEAWRRHTCRQSAQQR